MAQSFEQGFCESNDQAIDTQAGLPFELPHRHEHAPAPVRVIARTQIFDRLCERGAERF